MKCRILIISVLIFSWIAIAQNEKIALEIRATGIGKLNVKAANPAQAKLMTRRAAKINATRNLLAKIRASMPNYNDPAVEKQFEGFIAGIRYEKPITMEDGTVQIIACLSVDFLLKNYQALSLELFQCHERLRQVEEKKIQFSDESKRQTEISDMQSLLDRQRQLLTIQKQELAKAKERLERQHLLFERMKIELGKKLEDTPGENQGELQAKLGEYKKKLADAFQALKTLEVRCQEQNKALRSFGRERKQIEELQKKNAEYERMLSRRGNLQGDMERQWIEQSRQLSEDIVREREKTQALQAQNERLQVSNEKTMELLTQMNRELTNVWLRYQALSEDFRDREAKLLAVRETRLYENRELDQARKAAKDWQMRYDELWQSCRDLLQKERFRSEDSEFMENLLKRIYMNQRQMKGDLLKIKRLLTTPDAEYED